MKRRSWLSAAASLVLLSGSGCTGSEWSCSDVLRVSYLMIHVVIAPQISTVSVDFCVDKLCASSASVEVGTYASLAGDFVASVRPEPSGFVLVLRFDQASIQPHQGSVVHLEVSDVKTAAVIVNRTETVYYQVETPEGPECGSWYRASL